MSTRFSSVTKVPWWRSVRTQIAVVVMVISLAVSGIVGFVLAERSASAALDAVRAQALERLRLASDGYALDGKLRYGANLNSSTQPAPLARSLANTAITRQETYFDGSRMWASARLGPHVVLTLGMDARTLKHQDDQRIQALAIAALTAAVSSAALGIAAGTTLSRRLRQAANSASAIAAGASDIHARQKGQDEIAQLTRAVDDMAAALQQRLSVEKEFTSDVAHELRTPLTGLVSATELLPDDAASALVRKQVVRLRRLVEDLLEMSRLDRMNYPEPLRSMPLADAVRSSLERHGVPESLHVEYGPTEIVDFDERRLDRVLANLLVNLERHGGGAGELHISGHEISLHDQGRGYPHDILEWRPRPFHAEGAAKGSGLGLTIAIKHAEHMNARVVLANSPDGGALTRVIFTPSGPVASGAITGGSTPSTE